MLLLMVMSGEKVALWGEERAEKGYVFIKMKIMVL